MLSLVERAYENIVTPDGKPDWKKMRLERKRLKETRKKKDMKPEIYELTKEAKVIWEQLRREDCPPNVREKLCEQMHQVVKGHIKRVRIYDSDMSPEVCIIIAISVLFGYSSRLPTIPLEYWNHCFFMVQKLSERTFTWRLRK